MSGLRNVIHRACNTCTYNKVWNTKKISISKFSPLIWKIWSFTTNEWGLFPHNKQKTNLGFSKTKIQRNVVGARIISHMLGSLYSLVGRQKLTRHDTQDVAWSNLFPFWEILPPCTHKTDVFLKATVKIRFLIYIFFHVAKNTKTSANSGSVN